MRRHTHTHKRHDHFVNVVVEGAQELSPQKRFKSAVRQEWGISRFGLHAFGRLHDGITHGLGPGNSPKSAAAKLRPRTDLPHYELGLALGRMGNSGPAAAQLRMAAPNNDPQAV